jgi:Rhodopirellula transposase DDE domain
VGTSSPADGCRYPVKNLRGWLGRVTILGQMERESEIRKKWQAVGPTLGERDARLWAAAEARAVGRGGVSVVARATGMARTTIRRGVRELDAPRVLAPGRSRRPGGGRKQLSATHPGLFEMLDDLVDPSTRGDPMSPLRWCSKSTLHLAQALRGEGFTVSANTVARLLKRAGYSLQGTRKAKEGDDHPDRDEQFRRISELVKQYQARGEPVVSVDTKKMELVGDFAKAGREWQPAGLPELVRTHDFKDENVGKAIPYGIYDIGRDEGYVNVGVTHDTPEFAVAALRRWWAEVGRPTYPKAKRLLITADCGGSNGHRTRAWKAELCRLARDTGLQIRVAHFPPGTSKWNKIEHRLFCHITHNWRGRPLVSREVIVSLIGSTTTAKGLRVRAALDERDYKTGVRVSDDEFASLPIKRDAFHGDWNYSIENK